MRIRLAGPLELISDATRLGPGDFPGRQGRLVFAALVRARRPVDRDELAEMLWPNELPASWTRDLSAIVSKLRALLRGMATFSAGSGRWYAIELPPDTSVDVEDAIALVERAEKRADDAAVDAIRAALLLAEPFLPGDECAWVDQCRAELRGLLARALIVQAECMIDAGDAGAVRPADALVALEPDQERSHLLLVRAHLAANDRVGALQAYDALRRRLVDTFGLSPSAEAESLLRIALGAETTIPVAITEATRRPVVGREQELLKLRLLLDPSSPARVALIVGEPGIGKSRLAAEAAAEAHAAGFELELGEPEMIATDRRLLVVVEDVHALDRGQVTRLQRLVDHDAGVRVVATARTPDVEQAPVQSLLADLRRREVVTTIVLTGLDERGVAAMLGRRAELAAVVRASTGGNPLYVHEVARHVDVTGDATGIPDGLAALIDANLARLGAPARRVLEVAAVVGRTAETAVLVRACTLADDELTTALGVLDHAGVLVAVPGRDDMVRFEQPLVREVLVNALAPARRQHLHGRVAEAIEAYHHADVDPHVVELARHHAAAANFASSVDTIDYATRAGERASAVGAFDEARQWFEHAYRAAVDEDAGNAALVRALLGLSAALNYTGDAEEARATACEAYDRARDMTDPELVAHVVLTRAGIFADQAYEGGMVDSELVEMMQAAYVALTPPSILRVRLAAGLAMQLHFAGDREECLRLCHVATEEARATDDPDALIAALAAEHYARYGAPDVHARLDLVREIQTLSSGQPDPRWMRDYFELGDLDASDAAAALYERRSLARNRAADRYHPAVYRATRAALLGDLERAERLADAALEIGRVSSRGANAVAGVWAAQIFAIRLFDGRLAELRDLVDVAAEDDSRPVWRAAAAFLHLELGERDRAAAHFSVLHDRGLDRLPDTLDTPLVLAMNAWVAAELGTAVDCRTLLRLLEPYRDSLLVIGPAAPMVCAGPATYPLAVLAVRLGDHAAGASGFDDAVSLTSRIGARLWEERITRHRARVL